MRIIYRRGYNMFRNIIKNTRENNAGQKMDK